MKHLSAKLRNGFFNLKFRYQLLSTYLVISLIPIMVLGIFSYNQSKSLLFSSKEKDVRFYFDKADAALNSNISICEEIISELSQNSAFLKIFNNDYESAEALNADIVSSFGPYIYNLKSFYGFIREITFFSKNGIAPYQTVVRSYNELSLPTHTPKNSAMWYYDGEFLVFKREIYDTLGVNTGSLCLFVRPKSLMKATNSELMNYNLLLTAEDMKIIYSRNTVYGAPLPDTEMLLSLKDNSLTLGSEEYTVFSTKLSNSLNLFAYMPKSYIVAGSGTILHSTFTAMLLSLILLIIIDVIFSFSFTKRIKYLSEKISLIKNGELGIRLHSEQRDEIGNLTNDISDMTQKLDSLIHTVYEKEIQQKKYQLKALQAQINPHFLYNTLQTINWIAIDNKADEISDLVINLSHFYRATLNNNKDETTVSEELKMVKSYLDIERIILGNKFDIEFDVDENISDYQIIHLILQPITENAVEHGMKHLKNRQGIIKITAHRADKNLIFTVSDNGPGINENETEALFNRSSHGYGLKNVNDRIYLKYGEEYGIELTSNANPTTFTITLPLT